MFDYYSYYHCVTRVQTVPSPMRQYTCTAFDDPLTVPFTPGTEEFIIPIHKWIPTFYHSTYIQHRIRHFISAEITRDNN